MRLGNGVSVTLRSLDFFALSSLLVMQVCWIGFIEDVCLTMLPAEALGSSSESCMHVSTYSFSGRETESSDFAAAHSEKRGKHA